MRKLIETVAVAIALSAVAGAGEYMNLAYGDHPREKLDLYLPDNATPPYPLVIWIHGGAWWGGDKHPACKAPTLLDAGIAVASINYRLSCDATFPAQIHDCKGAVRWLRAHAAEYDLDPTRFGCWGSSAGGHLAALLGTSGGVSELEGTVGGNLEYSSRVRACADYYGPTDFFTLGGKHDSCDSPESLLFGACLGEIKAHMDDPDWAYWVDLVRSAGACTHVTGEDPPFHIAHGMDDPLVPPSQSQELYAALQAAGVPATLRMVPGAGHGLPSSEDEYVRDFFLANLAAPTHPGDLNCDGQVDFVDIDPFVQALADLAAYRAAYPTCPLDNADINGDGKIDFGDIDPFVELLIGGG